MSCRAIALIIAAFFPALSPALAGGKPSLADAVEAGDIASARKALEADREQINGRFGSEKEPILSIAMHEHPKPKLEMLKFLIESGADVNATSSTKGMSPLMEAAENCHVGAAEYLLKKYDAEPDLTAYDGSTALITAVFSSCPSVVEVMLKYCAKLDIKFKGSMGGETALQIARDQDDRDFFDYIHNKQIIKLLEEAEKKPPCKKAGLDN